MVTIVIENVSDPDHGTIYFGTAYDGEKISPASRLGHNLGNDAQAVKERLIARFAPDGETYCVTYEN